ILLSPRRLNALPELLAALALRVLHELLPEPLRLFGRHGPQPGGPAANQYARILHRRVLRSFARIHSSRPVGRGSRAMTFLCCSRIKMPVTRFASRKRARRTRAD